MREPQALLAALDITSPSSSAHHGSGTERIPALDFSYLSGPDWGRKTKLFVVAQELLAGSYPEDQQRAHITASGALGSELFDCDQDPALHPDLEALQNEVRALLEHAGEDDWDGEGAQALSPETVAMAEKLANLLPAGIDRPMIAATPHGEVDFDWHLPNDTMLTVSVGPSGDVAFAGLFDDAELTGKESWRVGRPHLRLVMCVLDHLKSA